MLGLASSLASASIHEPTYSIKLDGLDEYISANTWINWASSPGMVQLNGSIAIWVKYNDASQSSDGTIWSISVGASRANMIMLYYDVSEEKLKFDYVGDSNSHVCEYGISPSAFVAKGWTHITCTWRDLSEGEDGVLELWVDGTKVESFDDTIELFAGVPDRSHIGRNSSSTGSNYWDGNVDQIIILGEVLSDSEIALIANERHQLRLYSNSLGGVLDGIIPTKSQFLAHWKMNEGSSAYTYSDVYTASSRITGTIVNSQHATWVPDP